MDRELTDEEKERVLSWSNTVIGYVSYVYAPEIKHASLVIYDKAIR